MKSRSVYIICGILAVLIVALLAGLANASGMRNDNDQINDLIKNMTLEEKISMLTGKNAWQTVDIERLGIPSVTVADGPHGLRKEEIDNNGQSYTHEAVCFPTGAAMAATWNTELMRNVGKALAEECKALDVNILLGPGTNIKRTPLCGRNFEYFSEDPVLSGELSAAFIDGVQSQGIGTCLKHFAANNQEFDRMEISSEVDMRGLREIYLKPFEIAVKKSQPWAIMSAYNRLNGVYCSENSFLLNDVLKKDWGFQGIVISDWGAVHDPVKSLKASLDLVMPCNAESFDAIMQAYKNGQVSETEIDAAVKRILTIVFRANANRPKEKLTYDQDEHLRLAKEVALESITLLKNKNQLLPIKKKVKKLAIIGEFAIQPTIQGGGSSRVEPISVENPLDSISDLAGDDTEITYIPTIDANFPSVSGLNFAMDAASKADMVLLFVGERQGVEAEGYDRTSIKLSPEMEQVILKIASKNPHTAVIVQAGSAIDMSAWIDKVPAVVFTWYNGEKMCTALADILFGLVNPSGKIAETFPFTLADTPAFDSYPGDGYKAFYKEGIMVGYRYYDTLKKKVLFPFGYGLSYTSFAYSKLQVTPTTAGEYETVKVSFNLKNTGKMQGKETVQLYVRDIAAKVVRPDKELKAFTKIDLMPGKEKRVSLELNRDAFAYFDPKANDWRVKNGEFEILVGSSSRDIKLKAKINIKALKKSS